MKRKHMPGCYCCQCYEIDVGELPDITIPGWVTNGVWQGSECCKCLVFTPEETPSQTCTLSNVIATQQRTVNAEYQRLWLPAAAPTVRCGGVPVGGDADVCCQGDPVSIADYELETIEKASYRLRLTKSPSSIHVCVSKADVTCNGDSVGTKWIVRSVYNYFIFLDVVADLYKKISQNATLNNSDCFYSPNEDCPVNCEGSILADCESNIVKCNLGYGVVGFTRVKLYDDLPTGSVSFSNSDTPENCTWDFCENPIEYFDSFCWTISPDSDCISNCLCLQTISNPVIEEKTYTKTVLCCTQCFNDLQSTGQQWVDFPTSPPCVSVVQECDPCPSPGSCGTFTVNQLRLEIIPPDTDECNYDFGQGGKYKYDSDLWTGWFGGVWPLSGSQCFNTTGFYLDQFVITGLPECYIFKQDCSNSACYWSCLCGDSEACWPKWGSFESGVLNSVQNVTSFSVSWDCQSVAEQTLCLDAPTWNVTFS